MSRAAWEEGLLTLCRWADAVVCSAPTGLAGPAFQVFVWTAVEQPWSFPSQPRSKTRFGVELRSRFRLARRIESNQIGSGSDRKEGTLFRPSIRVTSSAVSAGGLVISSLGISMEPGESQASTLSLSLSDKSSSSLAGAAPSTRWVNWVCFPLAAMAKKGASVASDQQRSEKCAWL
jgi:hypothetical protein